MRKVHLNLAKGATLGSVDAAGEQLADSAIRAGVGTETSVHGVGDGALSDCQSSQQNLRFLLPPTSLISTISVIMSAAASAKCAPQTPQSWFKQQKQRLKRNQVSTVLRTLKPPIRTGELT